MRDALSQAVLQRLAAQHAGRRGSQAELAALVGWNRSHVTRLKDRGQIVTAEDGRVDFGASLRRIAEQADPARDAQRDAAARRRRAAAAAVAVPLAVVAAPTASAEASAPASHAAPPAPAAPPAAGRPADIPDAADYGQDDADAQRYSSSRARREYWAAKSAELDYHRALGRIVERAEVERAVADVTVTFRQAVDNQPHRLADRLVGQDLDQIRALLREDGERMLGDLQRAFGRALDELAGDAEPEAGA